MKFCTTCGAEVPDDKKFCSSCGAAMDATRSGQQPQQVQVVVPQYQQVPQYQVPQYSVQNTTVYEPISVGMYILFFFLSTIFPVGLIWSIVLANSDNPNKKNFGKGWLIYYLISAALALLLFILYISLFASIFSSMFDGFNYGYDYSTFINSIGALI